MNLSNIQIPKIKISIRIVAILFAILGLGYLYWTMSNKVPQIEAETAKMQTSNDSLTVTKNNLKQMYDDMPFYEEEIVRLNEETEKILTEFPTYMYLEDKILYADDLLTTDLNEYNMSQLSYGNSNYVMNVSYGTEESDNVLELYSVNLSGRYKDVTYKQIKKLLDYGLTADQRFVMKNITIGYNEETGYLSGDIVFTTYFIPGQATPYEFPEYVVEGLGDSSRIDDLFGARLTPQSQPNEGAEGTEQETEETEQN